MIKFIASEPHTLCGTPATPTTAKASGVDQSSSTSSCVQDVVHDILKRQEDWESERAELDLYLQKVKDVVSTGNATLISNEIMGNEADLDPYELALMERNKNESNETRHKILDGFRKIKLLDSILSEKTLLAESMASSKPSTSSHETVVNDSSKPHTAVFTIFDHEKYNNDDDDTGSIAASSENDFELKSVHSLDTRTFLTEPRLLSRKLAGTLRQHPASEATQVTTLGPDGNPIPEKKGYKLGDFIARNIVLGPQARYYHAMTEVEQDRVEKILGLVEDELGFVDDDDDSDYAEDRLTTPDHPDEVSSTATRKTRHSNTTHNPTSTRTTWLDPTELDRLAKIDQELTSMHGDDNKDIASLAWTPSIWTPSVSGISTPMYPPSSTARDVKSVMDMHDLHDASNNQHLSFQNEAQRIQQIDEQLRRLHECRVGESDDGLESQERIQELLNRIQENVAGVGEDF
ncbi:UNVERIFIED_CONTAM: hypothetical protein HDU68_009384 [Siphonaria sp. JEL0065]|nr:hypothetical protein HDU68_009384 [Siphonaria sp. JEL0065]